MMLADRADEFGDAHFRRTSAACEEVYYVAVSAPFREQQCAVSALAGQGSAIGVTGVLHFSLESIAAVADFEALDPSAHKSIVREILKLSGTGVKIDAELIEVEGECSFIIFFATMHAVLINHLHFYLGLFG